MIKTYNIIVINNSIHIFDYYCNMERAVLQGALFKSQDDLFDLVKIL